MMIEYFEMVRRFAKPSLRPQLVTRRKLLSSQEALIIARKRLTRGRRDISFACFSFVENKFDIELQINPCGFNETFCLTGLISIPELLIADLPGRQLNDVIEGSLIIDEVMGDRIISESYFSRQLGLLRLSLKAAGKGWWFERNYRA